MKHSYYEIDAVSQSYLKTLGNYNPHGKTVEGDLFYTEKKHFTIGDGVDIQLTQPELFDELFYVSELSSEDKPSDKTLSVIHLAFSKGDQGSDICEFSSDLLEASLEEAFQPRWGDEAKLKSLYKYADYWRELSLSKGKLVLTDGLATQIDNLVMAIRTHENTCEIFKKSVGVDFLYQHSLFFTIDGADCKALLDLTVIDHNNRTIQPYDFKTMGDTIRAFPATLRKRRYDIQASFYTKALESTDEFFQGYTILPFKFIVVSTTDPIVVPIVFTCSDDLLNLGENGRVKLELHGIEIRSSVSGWREHLETHKFYLENGKDVHKDLVKGSVVIDWEDIT